MSDQSEMVYLVSNYVDQVTARPRKIVERERMGGFYLDDPVFDSEADANAFVVQRATAGVQRAEADLRAARRRLAKCEKKYGGAR